MQLRPAFPLVFLSLLYWALIALSTRAAVAQTQPSTEPSATGPHIAVVLPLQSPSFGKHADSVRLGVLAAAGLGPSDAPPTVIYGTADDPQQILDAYRRAVSLGALAVIGPLTRNGVTALAFSGLVSVPTLALNAPDGEILLPRNLYVFGLQIEMEVRQAARLARRDGRLKAFVVAGETPLGMRIGQAFGDEWKKLKGEVTGEVAYTTDAAVLGKLREQLAASGADFVFLSLDAARARFMRSYLGGALPVYATSQVFVSNADALANYDLEGVRFLDMPWLLQPDHPAVMSYLRSDMQSSALDLERFYALGIDAYRLTLELLRPHSPFESLDGVTGTIMPGEPQQFTRALVPAQFVQGAAKPLDPQPAR